MTAELVNTQKVVVFFGLIAAGKSYLARNWAERHNYVYLNTDVVRKQLAGIDPISRCLNEIDMGIYTQEFSARTYNELLRVCKDVLKENAYSGVVLDGSYHKRHEREKLITNLSGTHALYFVYCYCSELVIKERLQERQADRGAVSDGTWEIYLQQKEKFDKADELSNEMLLELDTSASLEYLIGCVNRFLHTSGE